MSITQVKGINAIAGGSSSGGPTTNPVTVAQGGTGGTTQETAQSGLGIIGGGTIVNASPSTLPKTRAMLAKSHVGYLGQQYVLIIGDSTGIEGANNAGSGNSAPFAAAAVISNGLNAAGFNADYQSFFGSGVAGAVTTGYDTRIALGSSWTQAASLKSIGGNPYQSTTTTNSLTFTANSNVNAFDIWYQQYSGGGVFEYHSNFSGFNTTNTNGTLGLVKQAHTTVYPINNAALQLTQNSGAAVYIQGVIGYNNSISGNINVVNSSWLGSSSVDWSDNSSAIAPITAVATLAPSLIIINIGKNDWLLGTGVPTFTTNMQAIITACQAVADVILVTPTPSALGTGVSQATQDSYVAALYALTVTNNLALVDNYGRWATWVSANNLQLVYDSNHPDKAGYSDTWSPVVNAMMLSFPSRKIPILPITTSLNDFSGNGYLSEDRNLLINGDMYIDQANEGASVSLTTGVNTNIVDGWKVKMVQSTAVATAQQVADAPASTLGYNGLSKSLKVTVSTGATVGAGDYLYISQSIDGADTRFRLEGTATQTPILCSLSFWVKSSLTGTFSYALQNSAGNRSYVNTFSIGSANVWTQIQAPQILKDSTGTWLNTLGTIGMTLIITAASGSTNVTASTGRFMGSGTFAGTGQATTVLSTNGATFQITGAQLESGYACTPFAQTRYPLEIIKCKNRYQKTFQPGTAPAQNAGVTGAITVKNPIALGDPSEWWQFTPTMRSTPAITTYNPSAANANWRDITAAADVAVSVDPSTTVGVSGVLIATSGTVATLGDVLAIHAVADARP